VVNGSKYVLDEHLLAKYDWQIGRLPYFCSWFSVRVLKKFDRVLGRVIRGEKLSLVLSVLLVFIELMIYVFEEINE
jgi:hypothetical protein